MEEIVNFIKDLFTTMNDAVEPFVTPILNYLNSLDYAIVALVLLGVALLVIPGLFSYFKKAFKLFMFFAIIIAIVYLVWEFVVKG